LQLPGINIIIVYIGYKFNKFANYRIIMAYDLELWFIRSILFIGIARNLGPKLVMIRKMVIDFRRRKKKNFFWFILNTTVD